MKNKKKEYLVPEVTVVTFKVERGYAISNALPLGFELEFEGDDYRQMEAWEEDTYSGTGWTND